jgi:hypothetical protein
MIVRFTALIKCGLTGWTMRHALIFVDGKLCLTNAAQNRFLIPLCFWPNRTLVVFTGIVAFIARIIFVAALKPNGNNIFFGMIVNAACFLINSWSVYSNHIKASFLFIVQYVRGEEMNFVWISMSIFGLVNLIIYFILQRVKDEKDHELPLRYKLLIQMGCSFICTVPILAIFALYFGVLTGMNALFGHLFVIQNSTALLWAVGTVLGWLLVSEVLVQPLLRVAMML